MSEIIQSFSVELLGQIFDWLEDEDLHSVSSVCKYWFRVVNSYLLKPKKSLILRPEITNYEVPNPLIQLSVIGFPPEQFKELEDFCTDLSRLDICYENNLGYSLNEIALGELLKFCKNLKVLSFKNVVLSNIIIDTIFQHCFNRLNSLTFDCFKIPTELLEEMLVKSYFSEFKLIVRPSNIQKNLYATYPFRGEVFYRLDFPKYITSVVIECTGLSNSAFKALCYCSKLQALELMSAFNLEDDSLKLFTNLPILRKVTFTDVRYVTADGWRSIFTCKKLSRVVIIRCFGLSDRVFEDASAASHRLDLDLQDCKRVTGSGLLSVVRLAKRLTLSLDYSSTMINHLVKAVTGGLAPQLRCLNIVVQRLRATSSTVSNDLVKAKRELRFFTEHHDIHFNFKELFTALELYQRPGSV
ncbi:uncharacterized protein LOC142320907 [Lycorma delicatula]|uniref:uncharacterized protein LOC142320907 n=1 Tax=Lycorma delicatula TaxID=130591 RepID=UPI003F5119CB